MGKIQVERVVIDTNVAVSALLFGGVPGKLIPMWKSGKIKPIATSDIIHEYIRVLTYPKFQLTEEEVNYLLYFEILQFFEIIEIKQKGQPIIANDPSDDKFIHCAEAGKAKIILSGDQHLLALKHYKNIDILSPEQFIKNKPVKG